MTEVREGAKRLIVDSGPAHLTRREAEVLELMRTGMPTARIAERLFVSPGTVRSHVMSMVRKLHVSDRAALMLRTTTPRAATHCRL